MPFLSITEETIAMLREVRKNMESDDALIQRLLKERAVYHSSIKVLAEYIDELEKEVEA